MKPFQKKSKKKDAKSGQANESAATPAKKSRKPYPGLGDANLPMQTTPFLFFLESTGGLGNRRSQIATPRHRRGNVLQPQEPCGDAGVPMLGWWFLWRGPGGGRPHVRMVASLEGTWWWRCPRRDGGSSRGNLVVDTTTDVFFPAQPRRGVLVRFIGVLDVTGGVEGGGGHPLVPKRGHVQGLWDVAGHGGHTSPPCSWHQAFQPSS